MSTKVGRNDPCPCGSGKKFKRCHGSAAVSNSRRAFLQMQRDRTFERLAAQREAQEFQRKEQQGLGRPIIAVQSGEHRVVAVGNRVHASKTWFTFHDFLRDYPRLVLGEAWWQAELAKPPVEQHQVVRWRLIAGEQWQARTGEAGGAEGIQATGALAAYMHFAYDLYGMAHSLHVEKLLLDRIRSPRGFTGAMYEVRVAAALLRAGFTLELEDETDRRSTHVEFVATHAATGAKFSVEAKRREGAKAKVNKLLHAAVVKHAAHPRIVFIDVNDPRTELHKFEQAPVALAAARRMLKLYELEPASAGLPPAYVFATHHPDEHHLDQPQPTTAFLLWGFRIPDMAPGFRTLMEQVEIEERHAPVFRLLESMQDHRTIPATFDGTAAAYSRKSSGVARLQIGERLKVMGPTGEMIEAVLESGLVAHEQKIAWCAVASEKHGRFLTQVPLSDEEVLAARQHPSTFFGVVDPNAGRGPVKTPMDLYKFFREGYQRTPREKFLEFMRDAPNYEELCLLDWEELAKRYAVAMALQAAQHGEQARRATAAPNEPSGPA